MLVCEEIQRGARVVGYFALDHSIDACESNTSENQNTHQSLRDYDRGRQFMFSHL